MKTTSYLGKTYYLTPDDRMWPSMTSAVLHYQSTMFCPDCNCLSSYFFNNGKCPACNSSTYPLTKLYPNWFDER